MRRSLKSQYDYIDNLHDDLKDIIKDYTGNMYKRLNHKLRNNEDLGEYKEVVEKLDQIFNGVPVTENTLILYRGITGKKFIPELMSYISTSYDIDVAYNNTDNIILKITVPPGSKVLPIEDISETLNEKEILLHRLGKLLLTNTSYDDKVVIHDLVYLPINSINITEPENKIKEKSNIKKWTERLIDAFPEDYDDIEDEIYNIVEVKFRSNKIPQESIDAAIDRLKSII